MTATPERRTFCVRIEALDGTIVRVAATSPVDLVMSNSEIYSGGEFTAPTTRESNLGEGATSIDFGFVNDVGSIDRAQIQSGKWDGANIYVFATDWDAPVEDEEPISRLIMGAIEDVDGRYTAQMMGIRDLLNQSSGRTVTKSCQWTFCDQHLDTGIIASDRSRCGLNPATYTVTGSITAVTDAGEFTDSARAEEYDWFGNGEFIFTSGANAGLKRQTVAGFSSGVITLAAPFYFTPEVGDTYEMIAGCRKRGAEDCTGKFGNRPAFGGFSYVPTTSQVTKFGNQ